MRCPSNEKGLYVPPGHYTKRMLDKEARNAATEHSNANGGGRPIDISWEVSPGNGWNGIALIVSYYCNRPDGNCGRYLTSAAL